MPACRLEVPEILLQIFELVFAAKNGYPDLAGLARTCKAFNQPALAVLWRTQSSLLPLVLCFPRDVLEFAQAADGAVEIVKFAHPPSAQDWERPLVYANHIKIIRSELPSWFSETYLLDPSVLPTLLHSSPTSCILSRLRDFDYACIWQRRDMRDPMYMEALTKLSSPTVLQSLSFFFPDMSSADGALAWLKRVMEHCESIESFVARLGDLSLPFSEYFTAFASLQKLQSLVVWNQVEYNRRPRDISFPPSFTTSPNTFSSLVKLHLYDFSVSAIKDILKAVRSNNLQEVHFLCPGGDVDGLSSFLASHVPWQESMRSINIRLETLSPRDFNRLLVFRNLRCLAVHSMALDDVMVDAMAKAWPLLEDLCVVNEVTSAEYVKVTLKGLVSLQKHCPRLQHLELRLDASEIPPLVPSGSHPPQPPERPPIVLGIDTSSAIRNSVGVADFLMSLFPRAQIALRVFHRMGPMGNPQMGNQQGTALWSRVAKVIDERLGQAPLPLPRARMSFIQPALPVIM